MKKKIVITYGTFDLFHAGHVYILERARAFGDYLIVGLSTDEFNAVKGKKSVFNYEARCRILGAIRYVDQVIPEIDWGQKVADIEKHGVDTFVMGSDWEGKFDALRANCNVVYLPRTEGISSSCLKNLLFERQ